MHLRSRFRDLQTKQTVNIDGYYYLVMNTTPIAIVYHFQQETLGR